LYDKDWRDLKNNPKDTGQMKARTMYVEHRAGQADRGQAWIGKVEFSKSGQ